MNGCLGIDLTCSERRPSAWAALDGDGRILEIGQVARDADIVVLVQRWQPTSVAIDAPLCLPRGLTSLDDDEAARTLPIGRSCERWLKSIGIGCFYTTPSSIIKAMVYRGVALRETLAAGGYLVLEVFPYASKIRLLGRQNLPKKTLAAGRRRLQAALAMFIPDLSNRGMLSHDEMDAVVAAYTGVLHARGLTEGLGDPDEGLLWIPRAVDTPVIGLL